MRNASDNSFGGVPEGVRPSRLLSEYARSVGCGRAWVVADVGVDDVLVRCAGLIMLHNSFTPERFRAMSAKEFIATDTRLARLLRTLGAGAAE